MWYIRKKHKWEVFLAHNVDIKFTFSSLFTLFLCRSLVAQIGTTPALGERQTSDRLLVVNCILSCDSSLHLGNLRKRFDARRYKRQTCDRSEWAVSLTSVAIKVVGQGWAYSSHHRFIYSSPLNLVEIKVNLRLRIVSAFFFKAKTSIPPLSISISSSLERFIFV